MKSLGKVLGLGFRVSGIFRDSVSRNFSGLCRDCSGLHVVLCISPKMGITWKTSWDVKAKLEIQFFLLNPIP